MLAHLLALGFLGHASVSVSAAPGCGDVACVGSAPSVSAGATASPIAGATQVNGFAPGMKTDAMATVGFGDMAIIGHSPQAVVSWFYRPAIAVIRSIPPRVVVGAYRNLLGRAALGRYR